MSWAPELVLAHHSIKGADFDQRVAAAAAAGVNAIGLNVKDYLQLRSSGWTTERMHAVLDKGGVRLAELETVGGWDYPEADRAADFRARERAAFELADEFGVRHLVAVGSVDGVLGPEPVAGFAALCDRAAEHDLLIALEPQACTAIVDLAMAVGIVEGAARSNGGLNVDLWHYTRGGWPAEHLQALRADSVIVVQLDDGAAQPERADYLTDTLGFRRVPGEGDFDITSFLHILDGIGVRAPISIEVMSEVTDAIAVGPRAARLAEGTRAALRSAGIAAPVGTDR